MKCFSRKKNAMEDLIFIVHIFSVWPNILAFKHYILHDIQEEVVCLFFYCSCAGQWPWVQPLICDYGSGGEFPALQPRCWCCLDLCCKSSLVSSASTLDPIWICGTTSLCPVVVDARKIDGWILLFDCLNIWFWNLILRLGQVFCTSTSVC
jgi:hypothetical protein